MFTGFFYEMRGRGIPVTPTEWLTLMRALSLGLAFSDLVRFYHLARAVCVKSETLYDAFDQAWLAVFQGVEAPVEIQEAVWKWLKNPVLPGPVAPDDLRLLKAMDLERLRREFQQRLASQTERHDGGSHWIGTGGTSPFGHGGYRPGGLRVGGHAGGGMAAQIAARRAFANYRSDRVLDTRQIGVALKKLRRFAREGNRSEVDMDGTIQATARQGGEITVVERPERTSNLKVFLLMDAGGSMTSYATRVGRLFSAASRASHFKDFKAFYFHNCVYEYVFRDISRWDAVGVEELLRSMDSSYRLILVGDACMAPTELMARWGAIYYHHRNERTGLDWLELLGEHFERSVWLNPMPLRFWAHPTVERIANMFPMFELTLDGLEQAIQLLGGRRVEPTQIPQHSGVGHGPRGPRYP